MRQSIIIREINTEFKIRHEDEEVSFSGKVLTQRGTLDIIEYSFTTESSIYIIVGPGEVNNWYYASIKIIKNFEHFFSTQKLILN